MFQVICMVQLSAPKRKCHLNQPVICMDMLVLGSVPFSSSENNAPSCNCLLMEMTRNGHMLEVGSGTHLQRLVALELRPLPKRWQVFPNPGKFTPDLNLMRWNCAFRIRMARAPACCQTIHWWQRCQKRMEGRTWSLLLCLRQTRMVEVSADKILQRDIPSLALIQV